MAVVVLTSATGAPGVTTSALAMALMWPRPVLLIEADVSGGSSVLAGYLRGAVSPAGRSLLGLAIGHRQGELDVALQHHTVPLDEAGTRRLVPAVADPAQAASLAPIWRPLAAAFASLDREGIDVLVDAGRVGAVDGPAPVLQTADLVLLVSRTQLPAVASARARADGLRTLVGAGGTDLDRLALVLVGDGRPYTAGEISQATGIPVLATTAWDPAAAEVLSTGAPRPRRWEQGTYVRSVGRLVEAVTTRLDQPATRVGAAARPTSDGRPPRPAAVPEALRA